MSGSSEKRTLEKRRRRPNEPHDKGHRPDGAGSRAPKEIYRCGSPQFAMVGLGSEEEITFIDPVRAKA
jgi:hypothetical protein